LLSRALGRKGDFDEKTATLLGVTNAINRSVSSFAAQELLEGEDSVLDPVASSDDI
jgi:hypothetical protein